VIIGRWSGEKSFMRGRGADGFGWAQVDEVSGDVHGLCPKTWRHGGLSKKGANDVVSSSDCALSLTILWGCVGAIKSKESTMREKEITVLLVVKFSTIITLDVSNF
jgi:hypothetical protein